MSLSTLWAYLDDEGGRAPDLPGRMVSECLRFARISDLSPCGIARTPDIAERLHSSGHSAGLDRLYALTEGSQTTAAAVAERLRVAVDAYRPQLGLFPATVSGADIAARTAARLGCAFLSRCVDLDWQNGRPAVRRAVYNRRAHQVVCPVGAAPWIATIDPQVLEPAPESKGDGPPVEILETAAVRADEDTQDDIWRVPARELDVADADIVLSVGRGVSDERTLEQVHELAEHLGAAVGGSREAVFAGMVSREQQVGASGKWIAPRIYVALAISGSTYHMMGIREARHIVAVNLDAGAPIFERAEIGVIDDVAKIVPALTAAAAGASAGDAAT